MQNSIGNRIKDLRDKNGIDQITLAAKAGISQAALSAIETGKAAPRWGTRAKVAQALGVHLDWLTSGEGPEHLDTSTPQQLPPPRVRSKSQVILNLNDQNGFPVPHLEKTEPPRMIHKNELSTRWNSPSWMKVPKGIPLPEGLNEEEIILLERDIPNAIAIENPSGMFLMAKESNGYRIAYWKVIEDITKLEVTPSSGIPEILNRDDPKIFAHIIGKLDWSEEGDILRPIFNRPLWWHDPSMLGLLSIPKRMALGNLGSQFREIEYILRNQASDEQVAKFSEKFRMIIDEIKQSTRR